MLSNPINPQPTAAPNGHAAWKPFQRQGYIIPIDADVFEYIMPTLSNSAWKVLCFIILKTDGYRKDEDEISFSQIKKGTGIKSNHTIIKALAELDSHRQIITLRDDKDTWAAHRYRLNRDYELPPGAKNAPEPDSGPSGAKNALDSGAKNTPGLGAENAPASAKNTPGPGAENAPILVQKMHTHVVVVDNNRLKENLRLYHNDFPPLTDGQTGMMQAWVDDPLVDDAWIEAALSDTISKQPKAPFAYLKKMMNIYIRNGGLEPVVVENSPVGEPATLWEWEGLAT